MSAPDGVIPARRPDEAEAITKLQADVLATISSLSQELHPHLQGRLVAGLDGDLDRDFGLDSLGRVEAVHRLEAMFNVVLPDRLFADAASPMDLARAIRKVVPAAHVGQAAAVAPPVSAAARAAPEALQTLVEVLAWHAEHQSGRPHVILTDGDAEQPAITYGALFAQAQQIAAALAARELEPGARVALMLPTGQDFLAAFFGVLIAGGVPAPIYPPWRLSRIEEHLRRQARILDTADCAALITFEEAKPFGQILKGLVPSLAFVTAVDALVGPAPAAPLRRSRAGELALLQFTSGSTADPKGVMLTHANVLANARALAASIRATPADTYVSWLPLYHDMGLIAAWLACLDQAVPLVLMSPLSFMARPERWLWTIHRTRATITAAPNFAFEVCLTLPEAGLSGLDLSSLRVAGCGSEPISPRTLEDFARRFAAHGFRAEAFLPVYGLAECSAALTISPIGRPPRVDHVSGAELARSGQARPVAENAADAQGFVSCGAPLTNHEVRILGPDGREAPDRREGRLQFRGPSASAGYFNAPDKTAELVRDGWLESGDLGYVADGELFITGRAKDLVKRAGRNIHPADVESAICGLAGVEPNGVVLFSARDKERGVERLVLAIETAFTDTPARDELTRSAQELAAEHLQSAVDDIILLAPGAIPRTESGKVRRTALAEAYNGGARGGDILSPRQQLRRLAVSAALRGSRRALRRLSERAYRVYWWGVIGALGLILWPLVVFMPRLSWRWRATHLFSRFGLRLLGHSLKVFGAAPSLERVVVVANHSSYVDSLVLAAVLPGELAFTGFKELGQRPIQGRFVERLGALLIERFDPRAAAAEADRMAQTVEAGRPLVVFPEATIMRNPGLLEFRMGAFVTAARTGASVVPIAIRGTRQILRHDHRWFPRRGGVEVEVMPALRPTGTDFEAALALKDAARRAILSRVHEPDLAAEPAKF